MIHIHPNILEILMTNLILKMSVDQITAQVCMNLTIFLIYSLIFCCSIGFPERFSIFVVLIWNLMLKQMIQFHIFPSAGNFFLIFKGSHQEEIKQKQPKDCKRWEITKNLKQQERKLKYQGQNTQCHDSPTNHMRVQKHGT